MNAGVLIVLLLIGIWFLLLRTRATEIESRDEFDAMINGGNSHEGVPNRQRIVREVRQLGEKG